MSDKNAQSTTANGKIENVITISGYDIVWPRKGDEPKFNIMRNKITTQRTKRLKLLLKFYRNNS